MNGKPLPTIEELESILRGDHGPQDIEILPDGSIHAVPAGTKNDADHLEPMSLKYAKSEFFYVLAFLAIGSLLTSCTGYYHEARSVAGNYERDMLVKVGGTSSQKGADGSSIVTDDQQSLSDMATAAGGGYAVGKAASAQASNNAKDVAINASNNATAAANAKIAADAAAASAKTAAQSAHFQTAAQSGLFTPVPLPTPK